MFAQHLGHNHLREERLVDLGQKFPRHLQLQFLRLVKFDPDHESPAPHFFEKRMLRAQRIDPLHQKRAHFRRVLD